MIVGNIRKLAEKSGLSINKLETAVGLSSGTINKWDKNAPSIHKVKAVADYFGVSVDDLLRDNENKTE